MVARRQTLSLDICTHAARTHTRTETHAHSTDTLPHAVVASPRPWPPGGYAAWLKLLVCLADVSPFAREHAPSSWVTLGDYRYQVPGKSQNRVHGAERVPRRKLELGGGGRVRGSVAPLAGYYPATNCPDLLDFKVWTVPSRPTMQDLLNLRGLLREKDVSKLDWKDYAQLLDDTGMETASVRSPRLLFMIIAHCRFSGNVVARQCFDPAKGATKCSRL